MTKPLVFSQLSTVSNSNEVKRRQSRKSFSDVEYPKVTFNMVGPRVTPSKSKGKQLALNSEESDSEHSSSVKEILIELEGIY